MFDNVLFNPRTPLRPSAAVSYTVDKVLLSSGVEHRNARTAFPRKTYRIPIDQRPVSELREILDFFVARKGPLHGFRYRDPFASDTSATGSAVTSHDVQIGVGNDQAASFQLLQRNGLEVRKPVAGTVKVAVDAMPVPSEDINVDENTGLVTFFQPPSSGAVISAGCLFDTPVRFQNDMLTIQQTNVGTGEIDDLMLIEVWE